MVKAEVGFRMDIIRNVDLSVMLEYNRTIEIQELDMSCNAA